MPPSVSQFLRWMFLTIMAISQTAQQSAAQTPVIDAGIQGDCRRPWTMRFIPYGWAPGVQGDTTVRGETAPVDVSIGKTLDIMFSDLNAVAIGQFEASNGTFGFIFNGIYANVAPGRRVRNLDFSTDLGLTLLDLTLTYTVPDLEPCCLPEGSKLELLGGFRYNAFSGGVTVTGPRGNSASTQGTEDWFDPILGARLRVPLANCWTAQVRGDLGGFGIGESAQFVWNIEATVEYRCSDRCSLFAGYRLYDIDYRSGGQRDFALDVNLNGPLMGIAFDF